MTGLSRALALSAILWAAGAEARRPAGPEGRDLSVTAFGARGDGVTDDTASIQAAVDALPPGGTLHVPPGVYRVDVGRGVHLKDNMTLDLGEATLTGTNVDHARCRVLDMQGRKKIVISGGTLAGSRAGAPEWGMGILASDAEDLIIKNVKIHDFFYDGILLTGNRGCKRVQVVGCLSEHNRRTGLAVVSASDVTVEQSTFRDTRGQSPQSGANCEPNTGGGVRNVRFSHCTFAGNGGVGVYVHRALGDAVVDVVVEDSEVQDNEAGIVASGVERVSITGNHVTGHHQKGKSAIALGENTTRALVSGNQLEDNFRGIHSAGATGVEIRTNTVVGQGVVLGEGAGESGDGIVCMGLRGLLFDACIVAQNTVRRCGGSGVLAQLVSHVHVLDNVIEEVGQQGILLRSTAESEVSGNRISESGQEAPGHYDAIELTQASSNNLIANNTCRLGTSARSPVGIAPGCRGNRVFGNVVLP
jgi:nitrous oxidase accessory protein NosD